MKFKLDENETYAKLVYLEEGLDEVINRIKKNKK